MSISHTAYLDTTESVEQIAARVARIFEDKRLGPQPLDAGRFLQGGGARTALGTLISVCTPSWMPFDVIEEEFGVPSSSVRIGFQPSRDIPMNPQADDIAALVLALLDEVSADAVLTFNFEIGWLIRRSGQLVLHEDPELWPEHRLALVKGPYRRESHRL